MPANMKRSKIRHRAIVFIQIKKRKQAVIKFSVRSCIRHPGAKPHACLSPCLNRTVFPKTCTHRRIAGKASGNFYKSDIRPAGWYGETAGGRQDQLKEVTLSKSSAAAVVLFLLQPAVSLVPVSPPGQGNGAMVAAMLTGAFVCGRIKGLSFDEIGSRFSKGCAGMAFVGFIIGCAASMNPVMSRAAYCTQQYTLPAAETAQRRFGRSGYAFCNHILILCTSAKAAVLCSIIQPVCEPLNIPLQVDVTLFLYGDKLTVILSPFPGITAGSPALADIPYNKYAKRALPLLTIPAVVVYAALPVPAQTGWQG